MNNSFKYPVQMASIKKGDWRLNKLVNTNASLIKLVVENYKLWRQIKNLVNNASAPPKTCKFFPGSKIIGWGWEWAVYELEEKDKVVKIPSGIFPEVNEPEYLKNSEYAYQVCKKFLKNFVVETSFEKRKYNNEEVNLIFQRKLDPEQFRIIDPHKISAKLRNNLVRLGKGMLAIMEKHEWMPDMNLHKNLLKNTWSIWNLVVENEEPKIFDFTGYNDNFRLYPQRTKLEVKLKGNSWRKFLKELEQI